MITPDLYLEKLQEISNLKFTDRVIDPDREPVFNVYLNTREIVVPAAFRDLAVYMDHNAETVWFALDRYFDGVDLTTKKFGLQYTNAVGDTGLLPLTTYTTHDQDEDGTLETLLIGWTIPYDVTRVRGQLDISLRIFSIDEVNGLVDYNLSTEPATVHIIDGMYITDDNPQLGSPPKDNLNELVSRIEALYKNDTATGIKYENINADTLPTLNGVKVLGKMNTNAKLASQGGTDRIIISYNDLVDLPKINGVTLVDNKTDNDLGIKVTVEEEVNDSSNPVASSAVKAEFQTLEPKFTDIQSRIDEIWEEMDGMTFVPLSILSFDSEPILVEKGNTINEVTFNWSLSGTPTVLKISHNSKEANIELGLTSTTLDSLNLKQDTEFTLHAEDRKANISEATTNLIFTYNVYHGVAAVPDTYNGEFIDRLIGELQTSRDASINVNAGAGQYIFYAVPTEYGECTFTSGGFTGGFRKVATVSKVNVYNVTTEYDIWKSDYAQLGETNVIIS